MRDGVNDVAGMIEDVDEMAADSPVPQVTTQVVDRPYPVSQLRQWMFQCRTSRLMEVGIQSSSSASDDPFTCLCFWQRRKESVRVAD